MEKKKKRIGTLALGGFFAFSLSSISRAMHIMEGYLPLKHAIFWGVLALPFVILGLKNLSKKIGQDRRMVMILAMAGAYAFVLSALKIPSVTGSSSHPTGMGMVTLFFGPTAGALVGVIVLLFQALLLAHGGLTTLGANVFSMGVAGPFMTYFIYRLFHRKGKTNHFAIFLSVALGDLFTYVVTSVQLALAHPSLVGGFSGSLAKFMGIFAVTQVPLAIIEGILTLVVIMGLESLAKDELTSLGYLGGDLS
ncbi:MAG: energy-coupling factor ABC transporter permease [Tissierellia bacterium]|nr:energy-coupling factor ABC transporter permease [Tissierellia bacterium]